MRLWGSACFSSPLHELWPWEVGLAFPGGPGTEAQGPSCVFIKGPTLSLDDTEHCAWVPNELGVLLVYKDLCVAGWLLRWGRLPIELNLHMLWLHSAFVTTGKVVGRVCLLWKKKGL